MSVQAAVQFIDQVRRNQCLQGEMAQLDPAPSLSVLTAFAAGKGFEFTPDELRKAHSYDWTMRWVYFSRLSDRGLNTEQAETSDHGC